MKNYDGWESILFYFLAKTSLRGGGNPNFLSEGKYLFTQNNYIILFYNYKLESTKADVYPKLQSPLLLYYVTPPQSRFSVYFEVVFMVYFEFYISIFFGVSQLSKAFIFYIIIVKYYNIDHLHLFFYCPTNFNNNNQSFYEYKTKNKTLI